MWKLLVNAEVEERVRRLDLPFNRYGYDHFGVSQTHLAAFYTLLQRFYRNYFSIKAEGLEHVPPKGRAMLVGNHSGGVAFDGGMIVASVFLDKEPPRLVHGMVEKFLNSVPFTAPWMYRAGQFTGLPENAVRLLNDERVLLVFPEGARGTAKLYKQRNSLVGFGTGFMRLALQNRTPIVPFAFVGGGDIFPTIANLHTLGKLVGAPYIPITRYLLPIPLPKPCEIYYGEAMSFEGDGMEDDEVIESYVVQVRSRINELITRGCERRKMSESAMRASGWLPTSELLAKSKRGQSAEAAATPTPGEDTQSPKAPPTDAAPLDEPAPSSHTNAET